VPIVETGIVYFTQGCDRLTTMGSSRIHHLRKLLIAPILWWTRDVDAAKTVLESGRWEHGKAVARKAAKDGRAFGLVSTVVTLALPTVVGFATTKLWVVWQGTLIVLTGAMGYLLVPVGWAVMGSIGTKSARLAEALSQIGTLKLRLRERDRQNLENEESWRDAFERKNTETESIRGQLGKALTQVAELETKERMGSLAAGLKAPKSDLELLGEATQRNLRDVLRADLVYLSDELTAAQHTILDAYNNSWYWNDEIRINVWLAIKNKHLAAKGFHTPRSYVADAYAAIQEAENLRLMDAATRAAEPSAARVMHEVDRHELRGILDRILEGANALTGYITALDGQS
jgi:hypothetical protein